MCKVVHWVEVSSYSFIILTLLLNSFPLCELMACKASKHYTIIYEHGVYGYKHYICQIQVVEHHSNGIMTACKHDSPCKQICCRTLQGKAVAHRKAKLLHIARQSCCTSQGKAVAHHKAKLLHITWQGNPTGSTAWLKEVSSRPG